MWPYTAVGAVAAQRERKETLHRISTHASLLSCLTPRFCPCFGVRAAGTSAAVDPATGVRAVHEARNGQPPFSLDPDLTFIEMATEHRRVVDFLCQAFHRVSEGGKGDLNTSDTSASVSSYSTSSKRREGQKARTHVCLYNLGLSWIFVFARHVYSIHAAGREKNDWELH